MKLTKKRLILICAVLAVAAAVAVVIILNGNDSVKPVETVKYAYSAVEGETSIDGVATRTGDAYTLYWREIDKAVRGSYDEAAGTMENWGDEFPICDAGLAGIVKDDPKNYKWHPYGSKPDLYYYNYEGTEYYCKFNREDKTYERWTNESVYDMGWFFHEADGERFVTQIHKLTGSNPKGAVYRFDGETCNATEGALLQYEKQDRDGTKVYAMKQYTPAMYGERVFSYEFEDCGDELNLLSYEIVMNYAGGYADYFGESETEKRDITLKLKKIADGCYVDEDKTAICLFVDENKVILARGSARNGDGSVLSYEPGMRLEMAYQGEMVGCHIENDEIVVTLGDGKVCRLTRIDK